ncbi:hypothetical protein Aph02nite_38490 [Actinoplanes philippinensis]|uniref:Uncharacterized protein n=1 Tax=Actinoplanes philippinensis TaxID=35752 RepID=A0A1I2FPE4_9ACTN|nr:SitI3 family protein [Actinoplanes philippinensis]GIE77899.1 hypothetical protein Aph02nite_38490 [Actinoplanes philippinensis]SFF06617.1 hypothetical protein SAMN05421541_105535 [Actinoplanes philippinensis]
MALEYKIALIGASSEAEIAERGFPDPTDQLTEVPPLLSADFKERYGFHVTILARDEAYIEVECNEGTWSQQIQGHVSLTFRMDGSADPQWYIANLIAVVRRLLETGNEDFLLILDHDTLLLARLAETLTKHDRVGWWDHFPAADAMIAG